MEKFSRGTCTPEEEQFIIDWYNRVGDPDSPSLEDTERVDVETRIWAAINPRPHKKARWLPLLARAAAIALPLLAVAFILVNKKSTPSVSEPATTRIIATEETGLIYHNNNRESMNVALDDGSLVTLGPASEMLVSKHFGESTREVHLKGEAFFNVKPDASRPFLVYSNEVVTRVLGTSFVIKAYDHDGEITVAVKTGKVSVYANRNKTSHQALQSPEVTLTPNQQLVYHRVREVISKTLVAEPEIVLPNSNLFRMQFDNAEVPRILDVLAENYGVEIRYDRETLRRCRLTTSMSEEGLYERIEVICKAIGASYSVKDAIVTIESNGC